MLQTYRGVLRSVIRSSLTITRKYAQTAGIDVNKIGLPKTRNIGIIAHIDAGKTTTTERMIYYSGKIKRIGNVDEGDTVTDYLPSERERGITIQSAAITLPWNGHKVNIIDTPGHADFTFEVTRSLRVLDGAVTILDAVAGVEAQTEKVWKQARELNLPKIVYVNKMDRPGAGFSRTVKEVIQKLETRVVLCNLPYFITDANQDLVFKGVIDIIHKKLLTWDSQADSFGNEITVHDIESSKDSMPEVYEMLCKSRESMVETLGEFDDAIIDSFLENDEDYLKIPSLTLDKAIRKATIENYLTPVLCGASFRNIGVQPLMDAVTKYLPSPLETDMPEIIVDRSKMTISKKKKKQTASGDSATKEIKKVMDKDVGLIVENDRNLTLALAFKAMTHATRGPMTFIRVYSGKLYSNSIVLNSRTGEKLHIRKLSIMHGDTPEEVKFINSGNIGVIPGHEKDFQTGDTLIAGMAAKKSFSPLESSLKLLPIVIPPPLFNAGLEPATAGDEAYVKQCVDTLVREDPSLKVTVDEEMGQTILGGMGELHLDIVRERLVKDMKAKVKLRDVAVAYKESFCGKREREGEFVNEDESVKVQVSISALQGNANESIFTEEEDCMILENENSIIIMEQDAAAENVIAALEERRWKSEYTPEDLQEAIANGCMTAIQVGGPNYGFPLHSIVIRIKHWSFPVESSQPSVNVGTLMSAARQAVSQIVYGHSQEFSVLEPIMETKVYVDSNDLGEVSHDLTQRCSAIIHTIEDQSTDHLEHTSWTSEEAEKVYVPPDYTLQNTKGVTSDVSNKKVIIAETPLREMIGYLSKLRAMTKGKGTFDMAFVGMRRAVGPRVEAIEKEFRM
ncbi:MEF2 [[Candida] subhashii]|uniref:Ribosome-releasing factor 2, mitochondrial n=1 Tax=[Candida] subhashii TaxID=561895 RepID=A0A8J5UKX9_9ASCO|nr:MEF2 [[Candida] subhashii]KAG7662357.1 MEF2 [[Candida] subhashii]